MEEKDYVELMILYEKVVRIQKISKMGIIFSICSSILAIIVLLFLI